jgi:hypothetical protein
LALAKYKHYLTRIYSSECHLPNPARLKYLSHPNIYRFPWTKTSYTKLSTVSVDLLGLRISEPTLNSLSTAAEEGRGVLYLINNSVEQQD